MADSGKTNESGAAAVEPANGDQQVGSTMTQNETYYKTEAYYELIWCSEIYVLINYCEALIIIPNRILTLHWDRIVFHNSCVESNVIISPRLLLPDWATCHWSVQLVRLCPASTVAPKTTCPCWREWWMWQRVGFEPWEQLPPPGPSHSWTL